MDLGEGLRYPPIQRHRLAKPSTTDFVRRSHDSFTLTAVFRLDTHLIYWCHISKDLQPQPSRIRLNTHITFFGWIFLDDIAQKALKD